MATKEKAPAEVATIDTAKPSYLVGSDKGTKLAGLDSKDFIVPRIKLLQAISEEVEAFDEAKAGNFWHNVMNQSMGTTLKFVIISNKKRHLLMAPRSDARGILARADDAVHWSPANVEFDVTLKGGIKVKWKTADTVAESGLAEFGSSNPADPNSVPASTLFYEYLVLLPDFPELGVCLLSLGRSQAKKARDLNGKVEMADAPIQSMVFEAGVVQEKGADGPYLNYSFARKGWATEAQFEKACQLAETMKDYKAADEEGAVRDEDGVSAPAGSADKGTAAF